MPHSNSAISEKGKFHSRRGETPLTRVRDMFDAVEVRVLQTPACSDAQGLWEFVQATWDDRAEDCGSSLPNTEDLLKELLHSGRLMLIQEILPFLICFNNITRISTHQLVRQRVGVTFSQQCSADSDWRHHDVLIPRSVQHNYDYIYQSICAKMLYAKMVDQGMSIREARYILPQNLHTFLYMYAGTNTVLSIYRKRRCTMISHWEMIVAMEKMRKAIIEAAPYMKEMFDALPAGCWWHKAKDRTNLYIPDAEHDVFEWNKRSFEHGYTPASVACADHDAVPTSYYIGQEEVEEHEWKTAAKKLG